MTPFKNVASIGFADNAVGDRSMRHRRLLLEVELQDNTFRGALTVCASTQQAAEKLAIQTVLNNLRRCGIWASEETVKESYEEKTDKKDKNGKPITVKKTREVQKFMAPYYPHIKIIDSLELNEYDLSFSGEELEEMSEERAEVKKTTKQRRRTSNEAALAKRKAHEKRLAQQEKQQTQEATKVQNTLAKEDLLKTILEYFSSGDARKIKDASTELAIQYQKVRYSLFLLRDNGLNGQKYNLVETVIGGHKAYHLTKVDA